MLRLQAAQPGKSCSAWPRSHRGRRFPPCETSLFGFPSSPGLPLHWVVMVPRDCSSFLNHSIPLHHLDPYGTGLPVLCRERTYWSQLSSILQGETPGPAPGMGQPRPTDGSHWKAHEHTQQRDLGKPRSEQEQL